MAKRPRRGRTQVASLVVLNVSSAELEADQAQEHDEECLRIGPKRMTAITDVLTHCTEESYKLLGMHLVWVGDYSVSVVNDTILVLLWLLEGVSP